MSRFVYDLAVYVKENTSVTRGDVMQQFNVSRSTVDTYIKKLKDCGFCSTMGVGGELLIFYKEKTYKGVADDKESE